MRRRWRGRTAVLAIVTAALLLGGVSATVGGSRSPALRVSLPDGRVVTLVPLPDDGTFALRYRNSLYGTLAEERFAVTPDGRIRLVGLGAQQLAVLEEYYAIASPAWRAPGLGWSAVPARAPIERVLRVAATDLGRRTLLVDGAEPLELWRLVDDASPTVRLEVER
ncbi:MAG TPA: hypothetical protein VFH63_08205 [candidate division Zixibacteria bacterium]|nr:hypothetical protein [candidate division Zixibacteria bacterium]